METIRRKVEPKPLFSGERSDQYNALHDALILATADYMLTVPADARRGEDTKSCIYQFVEETPATSLVVELTNALNKLGWEITAKPRGAPLGTWTIDAKTGRTIR